MRIVTLPVALVVLIGGCSGTLGRGVPTHPDQLKSLRTEGKGQRGITVRPDGGGSVFWEVQGRASDTNAFRLAHSTHGRCGMS